MSLPRPTSRSTVPTVPSELSNNIVACFPGRSDSCYHTLDGLLHIPKNSDFIEHLTPDSAWGRTGEDVEIVQVKMDRCECKLHSKHSVNSNETKRWYLSFDVKSKRGKDSDGVYNTRDSSDKAIKELAGLIQELRDLDDKRNSTNDPAYESTCTQGEAMKKARQLLGFVVDREVEDVSDLCLPEGS